MSKRQEKFNAIARYQLLTMLASIAPDAPFPLRMMQELLSGDAILDGARKSVLESMVNALEVLPTLVEQFDVSKHITVTQNSIAISAEGQRVIAMLLNVTPKPKRSHTGEMLGGFSENFITEVYHWASFLPESDDSTEPSFAEIAMLPPHFFKLVLTVVHADASYALQALADLWLLNWQQVVAETDLNASNRILLASVVNNIELFGDGSGEIMALQCAEEMITSGTAIGLNAAPSMLEVAQIIHKGTPKAYRYKKFASEMKKLRGVLNGSEKHS